MKIITHNLQNAREKWPKMWPCEILLAAFLFAYVNVPKSHPHSTTQGETTLKLAPIYGLCYCQRKIPPTLKKKPIECVAHPSF